MTAAIDAIRRFNRFYTRRVGALDAGLVQSDFPLAESRLLWELAQRGRTTAAELARDLDLDPGHLSRLLAALRAKRCVAAERAADGDARRRHLALTAHGKRAFAALDRATVEAVAGWLAPLGAAEQARLVEAMRDVETLLGGRPRGVETRPREPGRVADADADADPTPWLLRGPHGGDLGWVVSRHGALYAAEYGWDWRFESLVARIAADFVDRFEPAREACWIAERGGRNAGCVFLVQARRERGGKPLAGIAQLRMLLVEPSARGLGIGARLVAECERFARERGYRTIRLWTNSVLVAARSIYRARGYRLVASEPHESFGHALVGETWERSLR